MREVPLNRGVALVDDEDYEVIASVKWSLTTRGGYAYRSYKRDGRITRITMHRQILDAEPGQIVDHIDGNGLNNTRANLRICTHSQNMRNRRGDVTKATSPYKGVFPSGSLRRPWRAAINIGQRSFYLGRFVDPIDAARAYDAAAIEKFGPFARLNFPEEHFGDPRAPQLRTA